MPELENEQTFDMEDFSSGPQEKTSRFLVRPTDLKYAQNARFGDIGGVSPGMGFSQPDSDLTTTTSTSTSSSTTTTSTSTSTSSSTTTSTSTS